MSDQPIVLDYKSWGVTMTLNRPENRNAMDSVMLPAFIKAVEEIRQKPEIRCLVISGTGRNFCGGADFNDFVSGDDSKPFKMPNQEFMSLYKPFLSLQQIEAPIIAAMNGHAIGGGLGLALMCDLRVANKTAKYGANFGRLGIHSGMAISYLLPRLIGLPRANELLFTGRLINGTQATDMGLANYAEAEERVLPKAVELAEEIASCAPLAVKMMKQSIYRELNWRPTPAAEIEAHCQSRTFETEDAREGIDALLNKRDPVFKGR